MDTDPAQLERARQTWGLAIETSADAFTPATLTRVCRLLRVKSFEREAFVARLPGIVRRGARVDLEPLAEALAALDVPHALVRRDEDAPAAAKDTAEPRPQEDRNR